MHPTDSADLLNVLLHADGGTWPRQRIRDEALTFMLAGHETTANAMSWFWYLMALHTEARDRMLAEVDDVLGTRRPSADDLGRLPWTTACLQESLRYFSAVWIIARRAIEDDVIGGTSHPPRHHRPHPDPPHSPRPTLVARPGNLRSRPVPGHRQDRPRSAYLPFGGGRRICIGQSFALMEMVLIAAIMSQRFTFDLAPGDRCRTRGDADPAAQARRARDRKETLNECTARHHMLIVGAGFSGIGAAIKLDQAGFHDFLMVEAGDGVGGTWYWNTYPGIAVDIPSFSYQFSFEQSPRLVADLRAGPASSRPTPNTA